MIKTEPLHQWYQSRVTLIGLSILTSLFIILTLLILIITKILNRTYGMFTELVLLFGLALNVFGNMCIHSIAEAYISYKRRYHTTTTPTGPVIDHHHHHHVSSRGSSSSSNDNNNEDTMDGEWNEHNSTSQYHSSGSGSAGGGSDQFVIKRQNQLFYPDLPSRDRFRTYLIALVCQIIYYVILNCLIFMIAKLVTAAYLNSINHKNANNNNNNNGANDNYKSNGTIMNWLWVLGAGVGFITIMFDAGSLIRTYVAFVMLKQENQMRKQAHSNLELVSTGASDVNNNHSNDRHHGGNDYYHDDDGMVDGYLDTSQVIMPEPSVATMRTTNQPKTATKQINDDVPTYTIAAAATEPSVPMFSLIGDDEEPF